MTTELNPTNQPEATPETTESVGFFERRWRLFKAGVKSFGEYLTKPTTYLYSAAFLGLSMLIEGAVPPGAELLVRGAQMIALGTLMHMGVDMLKEGKSCNGQHGPGDPPHNHAAQHDPEKARAQQQSLSPYDFQLDQLPPAPATPPVTQLPRPTNPRTPDQNMR